MQLGSSLVLLLGALTSVTGQLAAPAQTYYVPLPETQLFESFQDLNAAAVSGSVSSVVAIAIAADNTLVYYDHWEDGYDDVFLQNPGSKQASTQIWGDGDITNGVAPGSTDDILMGGTSIVLDNLVGVSPRGSGILYDGRDRVQATLPIAMTRYAYPTAPGSLMAGAVEVFNQQSWGRRYIAPIGQNSADLSGTSGFEYTRFFVMAGEDGTTLQLNGVQIGTGPLSRGGFVDFAVNQGDVLTSNRPVQVDMFAGDVSDIYELRWYAQVDADTWTNEYISPACETAGNSGFWFHNPDKTKSISISWSGGNTDSGTFTVPAGDTTFIAARSVDETTSIFVGTNDMFLGNRYSGVKFVSTDNFYAFAQIDSDSNAIFGGNGHVYDWGFPMMPTSQLTSQALVGLGRGCTGECIAPIDAGHRGSRSVIWVTPVVDTNIFVDFDGDGIFDYTTPLSALSSIRLTDDPTWVLDMTTFQFQITETIGQGDYDMTGAIIASTEGITANNQPQGTPVAIAVVWGQDPARSNNAQSESLDLGTAVLPLANPDVLKDIAAVYNPDGTTDPQKIVDQVGDIISYIIIVSNVGFADLTQVTVNDPLIQAVLQGPVESKNTDGILERGESFTYFGNYTVTASDISTKGDGDNNIENAASVSSAEFPPVDVEVETPIFLASISGNVKEDTDADNVGNVDIPGVTITLRDSSGNILATSLTDSGGNYIFIDLEAGDYEVRQTNLPGYINVKDSDGGNKDSISVNGLTGLQHSVNNDFVDERKGSISGTVTDNFMNPLVSVTINLLRGSSTILSTTTSTTGFYEFTDIVPGEYVVQEINLPDYVDVSDQDNSPDGDAADSNADVDNEIGVKLNSNEFDTDNDFVDRLRNGAISGKVTSDDGTALVNVKIELKDSNGVVVATKFTDGSGNYLFSEVVPGDYTVVETNPTDHPFSVSDQDRSNDGDTLDTDVTVDNQIKVTVAPGELDSDNDFQDSNNGKITGFVIDDTESPIPGVLISLNTFSTNSTVATTLTDSTGFYIFDEVEPGEYNLFEQNLPSYPLDLSDKDTIIDMDGADSNTAVDNKIGVTLNPGETDDGNIFQDSNNGKITGTVKNNNGDSLNNVKVELLAGDGTSNTVVDTMFTDSLGKYEFTGIEPGDYTVRETNPTEYPANIMDQDNSPDGDPTDVVGAAVDNLIGVRLDPGETDADNDFVDGKNGSISGTVKDDNTFPIANVLIELIKGDGSTVASTTTLSDGSYLFDDVAPGIYKLKETNAIGYETDVSDQDDTPDDTGVDASTAVDNEIDVVLEPGEADKDNNFVDSDNGSISGNVSDDSGILLSGVNITLQTQGGVYTAHTLTDSDGNYRFSDVEPGLYVVLEENPVAYPSNVRDSDTSPDGDNGETDPAADNSIMVTLRQSEDDENNDFVDSNNGSISGSVKDDAGNPIPNIKVVLKDSNGNEQTAFTNAAGDYIFNEIEPGTYTVIETNSPLFPKNVSDEDEDGDGDTQDENKDVDNQIGVTLAPGESDQGNNFVDSNKGTISGNVKSLDGPVLDNVQIDLLQGATIIASTLTGTDGNYIFENVAPGSDYSVVETNRADYPSSVSDQDNTPEDNGIDGGTEVDDTIFVEVKPGEDDMDNDFVDDNDGAISGSVRDDEGNPLSGVTVRLTSPDGSLVSQMTTNPEGMYTFSNVEPGNYVVKETNPESHPLNVRDGDDTDDGDTDDLVTTPDDEIKVTLAAGESDSDNNFVDSNKGSISGKVTDNGITPLEDVIITLLDENSTVVATTSTNSNGDYIFPDVPPGDYLLNETNPPGYPIDTSDVDATPDGDTGEQNPTPDSLIPVTIAPGEDDDGNNFQDSNDGTISGHVTNDEGGFLAGAKIDLIKNGTVIDTKITASDGFYKFINVDPGDYTVEETNPNGYPVNVMDQDLSDDSDAFDTDTAVDNKIGVTVQPGEDDDNNDFVDTNKGSIVGTVEDDNNNPLANVPIQLQRKNDAGVIEVVANTVTDTNGDYSFTNVKPGRYTLVETNLPEFPNNISDKDNSDDGDDQDSNTAIDDMIGVTLVPGEIDADNDFVDGAKGKITGTVRSDNNVLLSNVGIELLDSTGTTIRTARTNGQGAYEFNDVEPGDYTVRETNPALFPANIMDQDTTDDGDPTDGVSAPIDNLVVVRLTPGETDTGNDFVDGDNGSISGTVKDDNGLPIPDVVIELIQDGSVVATTASGKDGVYIFEDIEPGRYQLKEINPEGYTDVSDQDDSPDDVGVDDNNLVDNLIEVVLDPSEMDTDNNFVDSDNGSISGTVTDDAGNNLGSVNITLVDRATGDIVASTTTDSDGAYVFSDVEPGDYYVMEENPVGYPSNVRDFDTTPDGDADETDPKADNVIAVTLEKSEIDDGNDFVDSNNGSISGTVLGDQKEPLVGVTLELKDTDGNVVDTATTNAMGVYVFNEVEPGTYTVVETNPDDYPFSISDQDDSPDGDDTDGNKLADNIIGVTLIPGEFDDDNNFVDSNDGTISGTVTSDNGAYLTNVLIELMDSTGVNVVQFQFTDAIGNYKFEKVEPGQYFVIETNPDAFPSNILDEDRSPDDGSLDSNKAVDNSIPVDLKPGEDDEDNDFVDGDNGSISGAVKDDEGNPLSNVKVSLKLLNGTLLDEMFTNIAGNYTFNNIEPGQYVVTERNPSTHPKNVRDGDETDDGDSQDEVFTPDNEIKVTLTPGESDSDNNFIDSNKGSISGAVIDDENDPLTNVTITLRDENGTAVATTATDSNGDFTFPGVPPGDYTLEETNPPGYPDDISDVDTTPDGDEGELSTVPDNKIPVTLIPGEDDDGNTFKDGNDGSISGVVTDDQSAVLVGVAIELKDINGQSIANTTTNENGFYRFDDLEPGDYKVIETNPTGYPGDVYDEDRSPDGDTFDSDKAVDNEIGVTVNPGEHDQNNDFKDSNNGNIVGTVKDDNGNPIANVPIQLQEVGEDGVPSGTVLNTMTDSNGDYSFPNVEPGNYTVSETDLPSYPTSISDKDNTPDGDAADSNTLVDNKIGVTLDPGETDDGNDFVDSDNGSVGGSVVDDNGDPIQDVPVKLTKPDGTVVLTTVSDSNGEYTFTDVEPGDYNIVEENLPQYPGDVSDYDIDPDGDDADQNKTVDNVIGVTIKPGEDDVGNNFVDSDDGSISGSVTDDNGNPLSGVPLKLVKPDGTEEASTTTDSNGQYIFEDVEPGDYKVVETNLVAFPTDISDRDTIPEADDPFDTNTTVDNEIGVSLNPGEEDKGNDFVDGDNGSITGTVKSDSDDPLAGVLITLTYPDLTKVTTLTDSNGVYSFDNLEPGDYELEETNPDGYPGDMSDEDETPDNDAGDDNTEVDNKIAVTVNPGEKDDGNNFVDILASAVPSSVPSSAPVVPVITAAPILPAPPVTVTVSPSTLPSSAPSAPLPSSVPSVGPSKAPSASPSLPPSSFCEEVADTNCTLCAPYRSLDYCKPEESLPTLIQNRTKEVRKDPVGVFNDGYWFHYLEDKIAAYILSVGQNMPAPEIFCCVTNATALAECLESGDVPTSIDGIVIKATNMHSNQGVFVLVNDENSAVPLDLISGMHYSISDVVSALADMQATKIIAEEFIGSSLPTEYKLHVVNNQVAAIDVITNRGGECPCYAVVDADWNRLDKFGCFEPGGYEFVDSEGCTSIDFTTGQRKAGAVKKDLYICEEVEQPPACILEEMKELALSLGNTIGVYMRIDMFVANNQVFVQEYTTNHMNGLRHCAAKVDGDCIDSCFMGRMWEEAGQPFGGVKTPVPGLLNGFHDLTAQEQCDLLTQLPTETSYTPKCAGGTSGGIPER